MGFSVESLEAFKRDLKSLVEDTEACLGVVRAKDVNAVLEETVKPWAKKVVQFCDQQKKAAEAVLSLDPPPTPAKEEEKADDKPEAKENVEEAAGSAPQDAPDTTKAKDGAKEDPALAKADLNDVSNSGRQGAKAKEGETQEPPKDDSSKVEEDAPAPLTIKKRKPKAKGRKLPSKNLLATRAKEEVSPMSRQCSQTPHGQMLSSISRDSSRNCSPPFSPHPRAALQDDDAATIKLEESDMPSEVTKEEEEEPKVRRGTQAVPIFNAGVMGELNKALGVRATKKSASMEKKEDSGNLKEQDGAKKAEEKVEPLEKVALPALKPVKLESPKPKDDEKKDAEPEIPPWKLELQKRKQRKSTASEAKPPAKPAPAKEPENELAAILQRRKQKSGG